MSNRVIENVVEVVCDSRGRPVRMLSRDVDGTVLIQDVLALELNDPTLVGTLRNAVIVIDDDLHMIVPLDLMARIALPRRKRFDAIGLACDLLKDQPDQLAKNHIKRLRSNNVPDHQALLVATAPDAPSRREVASDYLSMLTQLHGAVSSVFNKLPEARRMLRDELACSPEYRGMEREPAMFVREPTKEALDGWLRTGRTWPTADQAIARHIGFDTPGAIADMQPLTCQWTQWGTWTGRSTAHDPPLQGLSRPELAELIVPEKGRVFVGADYRKAELEMMVRIAHLLAGHDIDDEPTDDDAYSFCFGWMESPPAKADIYRIMYGGGRMEEMDGWHAGFVDDLASCWAHVKFCMNNQKSLPLPGRGGLQVHPCNHCGMFGTTCRWCGRRFEQKVNAGHLLNPWMQASIASVMRHVIATMWGAVQGGWKLALVKHDELVFSVPVDEVPDFKAELTDHMEGVGLTWPQRKMQLWSIPLRISEGRSLLELSSSASTQD